VREIIKEYEANEKTLQLLGGARYTIRGIFGDKKRDEDFPLGKYDEAKDFYESILDLMKKSEGTI
jgi:hypothetical protein